MSEVNEELETQPKKVGRPKKEVEPVLMYAFTVEADNHKEWYPVELTIDKNTQKIISRKRLAPRGTTLTAAILSIEPHMIPYTRHDRLKNHVG